jgi:hypothetical protein
MKRTYTDEWGAGMENAMTVAEILGALYDGIGST